MNIFEGMVYGFIGFDTPLSKNLVEFYTLFELSFLLCCFGRIKLPVQN